MLNLYGLVLAGGQSRRMGTDKAHLKVSGQTLMDIMTRKLTQLDCLDVQISSNQYEFAIKDEFTGYGPVAGIHAGVKHYLQEGKSGFIIIVPVDMPLLSAGLLEQLVINRHKADLIRFDDYQFPHLIKLDTETEYTLRDLLSETTVDQGISLKRMFRAFSEHIMTVESDKVVQFVNCNTLEDLTNLQNADIQID